MVDAKFAIGQQVRHRTFGYLGVVVDVDPEYSLAQPKAETLDIDDQQRQAPWYYVVAEDSRGEAVHAYVAEMQLDKELFPFHPEQPVLDDFANVLKAQLRSRYSRH